jgi:hypothetical protein
MSGRVCHILTRPLRLLLLARPPFFPQEPSAQLSQLLALEHLLAVTLPERMREAPLVLKQLYDCDVIPEHLVTAW